MQIGQEEQEHPIENETKRDEGEKVSTAYSLFVYPVITITRWANYFDIDLFIIWNSIQLIRSISHIYYLLIGSS